MDREGFGWIGSARWDAGWLLSGLWLPAVAAGLALSSDEALLNALVAATLLLWLGHRFASMTTAYGLPSYRPLLARERRRFLLVPAATLAGSLAFFLWPSGGALPGLDGRLLLAGAVFVVWNAYHFAAQHYGVLSLYRARAGIVAGARRRRAERAYCLVVAGALVATAQAAYGFDLLGGRLGLGPLGPGLAEALLATGRWISPLVAVGGLAALWRGAASTPWRLYAASVALQGVLAFWIAPVAFLLVWGVQHWLVSIGLAARMAGAEAWSRAPAEGWYAATRRLLGGPARTVAFLVVLSVVLTPIVQGASSPQRLALLGTLGASLAAWIAPPLVRAVLLGIGFGTLFVHFLVDRAVFRFASPDVRAVSGRLLLSVPAGGRR